MLEIMEILYVTSKRICDVRLKFRLLLYSTEMYLYMHVYVSLKP